MPDNATAAAPAERQHCAETAGHGVRDLRGHRCAGGAAGIALERRQFSRLSGSGSANAPGGAALLIENGYSFANIIDAIDLEVAPICLVIASRRAAHSTFLSPYMACPIVVDATGGNTTELFNPLFAGNVKRAFAAAVGVGTIP